MNKKCSKCGEGTLLQMRIGGSQMPLCLGCMEDWDRACVKAFETFLGLRLPAIERAEAPRRIRINRWDGPIMEGV